MIFSQGNTLNTKKKLFFAFNLLPGRTHMISVVFRIKDRKRIVCFFWKMDSCQFIIFQHVTCGMPQVTCNIRYARYDMPHALCDMPATYVVNIVLTFLAFKHFCFGVMMKIWRKGMTELMNELIARLFVEQPWLHRVC